MTGLKITDLPVHCNSGRAHIDEVLEDAVADLAVGHGATRLRQLWPANLRQQRHASTHRASPTIDQRALRTKIRARVDWNDTGYAKLSRSTSRPGR